MNYLNNKVENVKIAYIGGGSRGWAWGLMSDLASCEEISGDMYLYDIDYEAAKHFTIVCNEPEPICDYIHNQLKRSATIFEGEGTYEHKKRYIILTVMKRGQAVELRNYIRAKEPNAFITIMNSSEIIGKGFRGLN